MRSYWMIGILVAAAIFSGCSSNTQGTKTNIHLAVEETGPEMDQVVTELKQVWGQEITVSQAVREDILSGMKEGTYDAGISLLKDSQKENVGIWSVAIGEPGISVVIADRSYGYTKDLKGKKIGCLSDLPEKQRMVAEQAEDVKLNSYQNMESLEADFKDEILDCILLEGTEASDFMRAHPDAGWKACQLKDEPVLSRYLYSTHDELIRQVVDGQKGG